MATTTATLGRRAARAALALGAAVAAIAIAAPAASAIEFESLGASVTDLSGAPSRQAGAHPDVRFRFSVPLADPLDPQSVPKDLPHRLFVDLPPGLIGNPRAAPTCPEWGMKYGPNGNNAVCPVGSQVGVADVNAGGAPYHMGVYNITPPKGAPGLFGLNVLGVVVRLTPTVRAGSYGITIDSGVMSNGAPITGADVTLWGVPADRAHDPERLAEIGNSGYMFGPAKSQSPRLPFLSTGTSCPGMPETTVARMDGWQSIDSFTTQSFSRDLDGRPFIATGCDRLPFAPTIDAAATARSAAAPTGLDVALNVPQSDAPDGLATAHVRNVTVKLPQGIAVSPSSANGLDACRPEQIALKSDGPEQCPDASKLGTVEVATPLLEEPLKGNVYLGPQTPGHLVNLYLAASGSGVRVKLPGSVDLDPATGQVAAVFRDNPQLPFSSLKVHFFGGPAAGLANPTSCGSFTVNAALTPWSSATPVAADSSFTIDESCGEGGRFTPALEAGLIDPQAGKSSPFTLTLTRPDGQQDLSGLDVTMAPGVLGNVASVPLCPEAQAAEGTCSSASQIGRTSALAGAGRAPLAVPQAGKSPTAVYLAGPYKGAPYSISVVVPAQAGPFDLGTVVVRAALFIDPIDGHVTVKSDAIPTIVKGVPLRIQQLNVLLDRPGFMVAPTSCDPLAISALATSAAGLTAPVSSRFQLGNCAALDLEPKLALTLSGKGQTTDGKHPAVSAVLTQSAGQSNLEKVRVALPLSLALDPDNANGLCEFVDGSKVEPTCPKASIVGKATAVTPILSEPLTGPVYFVKNIRKDPKSGREIRTLPKLVIPLAGSNGVKLTLTGTSNVENDQLVTTFDNIPDAPVSSFKLDIIGGKGGILVVSDADICKSTQVADQQVDGHSGKGADASISIKTPACALKVVSKKVGKRSVAVKVSGLSAGKVTVAGRGIKKTTKTIGKSTVATITAKRTKGAPGKVTVSLKPVGAAKARTASR